MLLFLRSVPPWLRHCYCYGATRSGALGPGCGIASVVAPLRPQEAAGGPHEAPALILHACPDGVSAIEFV